MKRNTKRNVALALLSTFLTLAVVGILAAVHHSYHHAPYHPPAPSGTRTAPNTVYPVPGSHGNEYLVAGYQVRLVKFAGYIPGNGYCDEVTVTSTGRTGYVQPEVTWTLKGQDVDTEAAFDINGDNPYPAVSPGHTAVLDACSSTVKPGTTPVASLSGALVSAVPGTPGTEYTFAP